jgi:hypothetical protein
MSMRQPVPYHIPPPGPQLAPRSWATLVTQRLRRFVPEMRAAKAGSRIIWRYSNKWVVLLTAADEWWLHFAKQGGTVGTGHPSLWTDRHDAFIADNVAGTMLSFFATEFCTPKNQKWGQ